MHISYPVSGLTVTGGDKFRMDEKRGSDYTAVSVRKATHGLLKRIQAVLPRGIGNREIKLAAINEAAIVFFAQTQYPNCYSGWIEEQQEAARQRERGAGSTVEAR
jgi:hypothetical protein